MWIRRAITGTWVAMAMAAAVPAAAQQSEWIGIQETKARLIAAKSAVDGFGTLDLGLQFRLEPGWKTYWRSPGEAGMPAQLDWSKSENVAGAELLWPLPKRFTAFDLSTYGYGDEVILPIRLSVAEPRRAVSARLRVFYQICRDICIPVEADLVLDLPAAGGGSSVHAGVIQHYLSQVPMPDGGPFEIREPAITGAPGAEVLHFTVASTTPLNRPDVLVEAPWPFGFDVAEVSLAEDRLGARVTVPVRSSKGDGSLAAHAVTVTFVDGARAGEKTLALAAQ